MISFDTLDFSCRKGISSRFCRGIIHPLQTCFALFGLAWLGLAWHSICLSSVQGESPWTDPCCPESAGCHFNTPLPLNSSASFLFFSSIVIINISVSLPSVLLIISPERFLHNLCTLRFLNFLSLIFCSCYSE